MNVTFLSAKQTHEFMDADPDNFFGRLRPIDLKARNVRSAAAYKKQSLESVQDFSDDEKFMISENVKQANNLFSKWLAVLPGINNIPWVFAKCDQAYEAGLPHTRCGIIFTLGGELGLRECLHEKIHIFQRLHKDIVDQYISSRGYIRIYGGMPPLRRSNPDIDEFTYMKNGRLCDGIYDSPNPPHISYTGEDIPHHPLEAMAYELTNRIKGN